MEEPVSEQKILPKKDNAPFGCVFVPFVAAGVMSLIGVILGAINFASPMHYPAWIVAVWLVMNLFLELFLLLHTGIYAYLIYHLVPDGEGGMFATMFIPFLFILIGGWVLLGERHFGWFSAFALGLVCVAGFIDFLVWVSLD